MEQMVSASQKKAFIEWLVERELLGSRDVTWLFQFLMGHMKLLDLIHFVNHINGCHRAIEVGLAAGQHTTFKYIKETVHTSDPEKAFHDLRLNQDDPVFVQIGLPSVGDCPYYYSVLEDGPGSAAYVHETFGWAAEDAAGAAERAYRESRLYRAINEALDSGDKKRFLVLSGKLKRLRAADRAQRKNW
ncbi:MAG: YpiB family protein [Sporolactobacillus sp.]|jgi:uncharacterized protein YpiB (UPF0302 family)|nr:YpiB family protein [Sporolactobacillus sp.]